MIEEEKETKQTDLREESGEGETRFPPRAEEEAFPADTEPSPTGQAPDETHIAARQISSTGSDDDEPQEGGRFLSAVFDWVELFAISLAIVVTVMTFFVRHSPVVGASMEPTVHGKPAYVSQTEEQTGTGDVMLISNLFYTPKRGDIVVINSPHNLEEPIIKRIIGVGGDTVELYFNEWKTVVNGVELDEPYLYTSYTENGTEQNPNLNDRIDQPMASGSLDPDGDGYEKIEVPEGSVFVMGDHRNNSKDSRSLGCMDQRSILGKVLLRVYPFEKFGKVN